MLKGLLWLCIWEKVEFHLRDISTPAETQRCVWLDVIEPTGTWSDDMLKTDKIVRVCTQTRHNFRLKMTCPLLKCGLQCWMISHHFMWLYALQRRHEDEKVVGSKCLQVLKHELSWKQLAGIAFYQVHITTICYISTYPQSLPGFSTCSFHIFVHILLTIRHY